MGISQHVHGTDNARCLIALALVTGQVGRPGTGLHPLRGQNNVQGASDAGLIPMVFPDYQSVEKPAIREQFESFWNTALDPVRGLTVVEIINAIHAGQIRGMYIEGENPAMSDPDLNHAREALAKLEHLVVQDLFLTETAFHADVVLPASAFAEKSGTFTNTDRRVQLARPVIEPAGRRAAGLVDHPGDRAAAGPRLGLCRTERCVRRDGAGHAVVQQHHLGTAGARRRRHLPGGCAGQAGQRDHLLRRFPDRERAREDRARQRVAARRSAGRRLSDGAVHRPGVGALAYRLDDAPLRRAGCDRARGGRLHVAAESVARQAAALATSSGSRRGEAPWR